MKLVVARGQLMTRLREAGWGFHRRAKRMEIWKKHGSVDRITLPTSDYIDVALCRAILREAGLVPQQVEGFLSACIKN